MQTVAHVCRHSSPNATRQNHSETFTRLAVKERGHVANYSYRGVNSANCSIEATDYSENGSQEGVPQPLPCPAREPVFRYEDVMDWLR